MPWYIIVWLWSWYKGYARATSQVHHGPTLRILFNKLVSWRGMGWGYNASQYQTQTIQVHTCLNPEDTNSISGDFFFFLKDPNRWFLPPKLYTFMFGHQPSMEVNTRPKVICCSMSWWPKVHTATSWIAIAPGTFVDLVIHHLSSALPHLPCHLSNKIKRWHKNVS